MDSPRQVAAGQTISHYRVLEQVEAVVEGSTQKLGERAHVTARLIDAATERPLWSDDFDRDTGDFITTIDIWCVMRDARRVRTTLDIADDVLQAARELASARGESTGAVLSALARKGLAGPRREGHVRNGVPLLPHRPRDARRPTMKLVNQLRDEA